MKKVIQYGTNKAAQVAIGFSAKDKGPENRDSREPAFHISSDLFQQKEILELGDVSIDLIEAVLKMKGC